MKNEAQLGLFEQYSEDVEAETDDSDSTAETE